MLIFLLIVVQILPLISYADYTNKIDPNKNWGVWEGWGTSLAWWANVFGDRDDIADLMFTTKNVQFNNQTLPGLGFNIARYNLGGCAWRTVGQDKMVESPNIPKWKQMSGYWLDWYSDDPNSKSWNWTVDSNQRLMLDKARDRGVDQIEMFSNSPMWWMLNNHNPSGGPNGVDNLQETYYKQFAIYLATVAKYAHEQWNISFTSIDAFNEPSSPWSSDGAQEGCHISVNIQQKVIEYLRPELDLRGLNHTIISASDETNYDQAITTWNSFLDNVKSKVGRVNVHGYEYIYGKRDVLYAVVHKDRKAIWNSEYGEGVETGLPMAEYLGFDLFTLHPTAWIYWQPFDIKGWGMIETDCGSKWLGNVSTKYYVMAHYSRHIRKGMQILETSRSDSVVAFDRSANRLVVVVLNKDVNKSEKITFDFSLFTRISAGPVKRWTTDVGKGSHYVFSTDLQITDKSIDITCDPRTVQTFEINKVFL